MSEYRKKLIEVALPLDEINAACKADKDRKTGTIRNLHKWFAPMPLPAWRALLFAAVVDDPDDDERRAYLLDVIKRLVANGADLPDDDVIEEARIIIEAQFPDGVPTVMDPFCGGGSTLVEAQRLGLPSVGSDLNPVPVLITRTLTEVLPRVRGGSGLHPTIQSERRVVSSSTAQFQMFSAPEQPPSGDDPFGAFAVDVRHYARAIQERAWERVGAHYRTSPGATSAAWLWVRTAACPSPACASKTILTTSLWLSKRPGDLAWIQPKLGSGSISLDVVSGRDNGAAPAAPKSGRATFSCVACGAPLDEKYLRSEGLAGRLGLRMAAVVEESGGRRLFRRADERDVAAAAVDVSEHEFFDVPLSGYSRDIRPTLYGFASHADLYLPRQLHTLTTFADLVGDLKGEVLRDGGTENWAIAVATVLGLALGKLAGFGSTQCRWYIDSRSGGGKPMSAFGRNDLPMLWDFAESNPFSATAGGWMQCVELMIGALPYAGQGIGVAERSDARTVDLAQHYGRGLVATDPPYFDAISYADLSDYFYLWHRRALRHVHTDLYATTAAPKTGELTAIPSHHGNDKVAAGHYFVEGFTETFQNLKRASQADLPLVVVYASKEQKGGREEETRWSSILRAMVGAGLEITGTWPIHGTGSQRMVSLGTNSVATYVAMVCRSRSPESGDCSLSDFNRALRRELKPAVQHLQSAGILPVDLAQAAMGPGMQVFSRYRAVLDQSGANISVEFALRLINQALSEVLDEQEGDLDPDSRFAVAWWDKHHWQEAAFGEADQLARPQGISVDDVIRAGVASYPRPGFVRVIGDGDLDRGWDPAHDTRPTAWEAVHHLADRLIDGGGVSEAGALMGRLGVFRDPAQALVYRLHAIAARKGWTKDQERYNALIGSWSDLLAEAGRAHGEVDGLF